MVSPALLAGVVVLTGVFAAWLIYRRQQAKVKVYGIDPRVPFINDKKLRVKNGEVVWSSMLGDDIRIPLDGEFVHQNPTEGTAYVVDLSDGRVMKFTEHEDILRVDGKRLEEHYKDESYNKLANVAFGTDWVMFALVGLVGMFVGVIAGVFVV